MWVSTSANCKLLPGCPSNLPWSPAPPSFGLPPWFPAAVSTPGLWTDCRGLSAVARFLPQDLQRLCQKSNSLLWLPHSSSAAASSPLRPHLSPLPAGPSLIRPLHVEHGLSFSRLPSGFLPLLLLSASHQASALQLLLASRSRGAASTGCHCTYL